MKPIFTAEDFYDCDSVGTCAADEVAEIANAKIESMLGPVVYGHGQGTDYWDTKQREDDAATAILFNIQELPKKECDHYSPSFTMSNPRPHEGLPVPETKCCKCGQEFKAVWSPK